MSPARPASPASGLGDARRGGFGERIVLVFLILALATLVYVYVRALPEQVPQPPDPFDLRNPMLDAEIGECVEIESTTNPGMLICARVREPGVVLRPRSGPDKLGLYPGLRRSRPYLACELRYPPPGKTCADGAAARTDIELFALNAFGMPYGVDVTLDAIQPRWVQYAGRQVYVYEVQLTQYGAVAGQTWIVDVHADAPVGGVLRRRHGTERGEMHTTIFTATPDCR